MCIENKNVQLFTCHYFFPVQVMNTYCKAMIFPHFNFNRSLDQLILQTVFFVPDPELSYTHCVDLNQSIHVVHSHLEARHLYMPERMSLPCSRETGIHN